MILCPAGELARTENPRACRCRIAQNLVRSDQDEWSLAKLCEGEYSACAIWRDEKESRWKNGHGVLKQLEREYDARHSSDDAARVRAMSERMAEADAAERSRW